jgi:hypothetical protein
MSCSQSVDYGAAGRITEPRGSSHANAMPMPRHAIWRLTLEELLISDGDGSGATSTPFTALKTAALAPMASARVTMAVSANPGARRNSLTL